MNTHGGSSGDAPNSPSGGGKRKMDTQEALTIDTIRAAIQEELRLERRELKRELLAEVREVREEVRGHLRDTNRILKDLQALQTMQGDDLRKLDHVQQHQAGALETLTADQKTLHDRLALLEGKFGTWQGSSHGGSSASTTDDEKRQPALIMGGWPEDSLASDTLQQAHQTAAQLHLEVDLGEAFVPGIRRGYTIIPIKAKEGEDDAERRRRIQQAIQKVRNANVVLGTKPDGTPQKLWMALSQSPQRRAKAKLAGKTKRLALEQGGDPRRVEAEFATGTVWYRGTKISSGTATAPANATTAGAGWIDLEALARLLNCAPGNLQSAWERIKQGL